MFTTRQQGAAEEDEGRKEKESGIRAIGIATADDDTVGLPNFALRV